VALAFSFDFKVLDSFFCRFFRSFLLLALVHLMSSALFRLIAGVCRTMVIANTGGTCALVVFVLLGGFFIPRGNIKPWWIWGYWSSPITYAQSALTVNEFLAPRWATVSS
jgi:ABC-type multidrug transport system permease subunit